MAELLKIGDCGEGSSRRQEPGRAPSEACCSAGHQYVVRPPTTPRDSGEPQGAYRDFIYTDYGSLENRRADLKATGMAARGWAWTAYDWDEGRLFNYIGDAQNTYPIWNATPLVALDVYEHAYFLDYQTDRGAYIDAFLRNLDWDVVNGWIRSYKIPTG
jgi:superoxide dismutase